MGGGEFYSNIEKIREEIFENPIYSPNIKAFMDKWCIFLLFYKKKYFWNIQFQLYINNIVVYKLSTVFNCLFGYNTGVDSGKFILTLPVNMFVNKIIVPLYTPDMVPWIDIGIA